MEPYYLAAYAFYALEVLFKKGKLEGKLKPARFHIIMAARLLIGEPAPVMHANEMAQYCDGIMKILWDNTSCENLLLKAAEIVTKVANNDFQRDNIRAEPFTKRVIQAFAKQA